MDPQCPTPAPQDGEGCLLTLLTEKQVAAKIKMHPKTLERARHAGRPILPYVRLSHRKIRYDPKAVVEALARATRAARSAPAAEQV
jgi:hypothetical protein